MKAVINIQRFWRGYKARKYIQKLKNSSYRSKRLVIESP